MVGCGTVDCGRVCCCWVVGAVGVAIGVASGVAIEITGGISGVAGGRARVVAGGRVEAVSAACWGIDVIGS